MRIIINEEDQKTKFFKMATLFCREYNKHLPPDAAPEDRAQIVLPYSFLLSKVKHALPESLSAVRNGDQEKNFIILVNENRDLFRFVFTQEDQALYNKMYSAAQTLLTKYKAMEKQHATKREEEPDSPAEGAKWPIPRHSLNMLRASAKANDQMLAILGQNVDTWFSDRGIGADEALKPHPSDHTISRAGLFLAMLQSPDARKALDIPDHQTSFPAITEKTLPQYQDLFRKAVDVMDRVHTLSRIAEQSNLTRRVESMARTKIERPPVSKGQMENVVEDALRYTQALEAINPEWLQAHGIANSENVLEYEGKKATVSGAPLFQGLIQNSTTRKLIVSDGEAKRAAQLGMYSLAVSDEPTVFAVEDQKFYDEHVKGRGQQKDQNPEKMLPGGTPLIEGEVRTDEHGLVPPRVHDKSGLVGFVDSAKPLFDRPRRRPRQTTAERLEAGFPHLDVPLPGLLYANLKTRLSALKIGHPEREESIDKALLEMHTEIMKSGHATTGHSSSGKSFAETPPEPDLDPDLHSTAAANIRSILESSGSGLHPKVVRHLEKAERQASSEGRGGKK